MMSLFSRLPTKGVTGRRALGFRVTGPAFRQSRQTRAKFGDPSRDTEREGLMLLKA